MVNRMANAGILGSVVALFAAACCVLPMVMMLLGLGGSWLAVFGAVAGVSQYIAAASAILVAAAWSIAIRRGGSHGSRGTRVVLVSATVLVVAAWVLLLNEAGINDYLISWM